MCQSDAPTASQSPPGHSAWLCLTWHFGVPGQTVCMSKLWGDSDRVLVPMQMLAKANRERLAVLLEEARSGAGGDERYAASLR